MVHRYTVVTMVMVAMDGISFCYLETNALHSMGINQSGYPNSFYSVSGRESCTFLNNTLKVPTGVV